MRLPAYFSSEVSAITLVFLLLAATAISKPQKIRQSQPRHRSLSAQFIEEKETDDNKYTSGAQPRCPISPPGLVAQLIDDESEIEYSGCGEKKWTSILVTKDLFNEPCDQRDECYGGCRKSFERCNDQFLLDMVNACQLESLRLDFKLFSYDTCVIEARWRAHDVRGLEGRKSFKAYNEERCKCDCKGAPRLCGDECVNIKEDSKHCGSCDHVCGPGLQCEGGKCISKLDAHNNATSFDERFKASPNSTQTNA